MTEIHILKSSVNKGKGPGGYKMPATRKVVTTDMKCKDI